MVDIYFLNKSPKWCSWSAGGLPSTWASGTQAPSNLWLCPVLAVASMGEMASSWPKGKEKEGCAWRVSGPGPIVVHVISAHIHWPELTHLVSSNCKIGRWVSFTCVSRKKRKDAWGIIADFAGTDIVPPQSFLLMYMYLKKKKRVSKLLVSHSFTQHLCNTCSVLTMCLMALAGGCKEECKQCP